MFGGVKARLVKKSVIGKNKIKVNHVHVGRRAVAAGVGTHPARPGGLVFGNRITNACITNTKSKLLSYQRKYIRFQFAALRCLSATPYRDCVGLHGGFPPLLARMRRQGGEIMASRSAGQLAGYLCGSECVAASMRTHGASNCARRLSTRVEALRVRTAARLPLQHV